MNNLISDKQQSLTYYIFLPYMQQCRQTMKRKLKQWWSTSSLIICYSEIKYLSKSYMQTVLSQTIIICIFSFLCIILLTIVCRFDLCVFCTFFNYGFWFPLWYFSTFFFYILRTATIYVINLYTATHNFNADINCQRLRISSELPIYHSDKYRTHFLP
jgi:hypothetical protein